ncbi:MAG TPA: sterol desaturase family protein [Mycobacteriales bacterium]|nr:sterol desaturase family protein [Mycobacteriales bacterium]
MPPTPVPRQPGGYTAPGLTLGPAARIFLRYRNIQLIAPLALLALGARLALGHWQPGDLLVAGVVVGLESFTEWVIHVFVLHFRPRLVAGRRFDPLAARKHRAHHRDPKVIELVLIPFPVLAGSLAVAAVGFLLAMPTWQLACTAIAATFTMLGGYEWTHFLIHSSYLPRSRYYRYIWRAHRLHHFRNERYWFGITVHLADHLLGTFPDRDAVQVSATARTLGVEQPVGPVGQFSR